MSRNRPSDTVIESLGCKAIRMFGANELQGAFTKARQPMEEFRVPVVVEVILERITNIAMGTEINGKRSINPTC